MHESIHSQLTAINSLVAAVRTATAAGAGVDTQGYDAAELVYHFGVGGITFDATNKLGLKLEHSADNATWSAVADADVNGYTGLTAGVFLEFTSAQAAAQAVKIGYVGGKRYLRPSLVFSGTHGTGTACGAVAILGEPELMPAP